jgi:hypothetical protein
LWQTTALPRKQPFSQMAAFSVLHTKAGACRGHVERPTWLLWNANSGPWLPLVLLLLLDGAEVFVGPRTLLPWTNSNGAGVQFCCISAFVGVERGAR